MKYTYEIWYSALHPEDEEYIKELEQRMKNKDFKPTQEDMRYLAKFDENGKLITN